MAVRRRHRRRLQQRQHTARRAALPTAGAAARCAAAGASVPVVRLQAGGRGICLRLLINLLQICPAPAGGQPLLPPHCWRHRGAARGGRRAPLRVSCGAFGWAPDDAPLAELRSKLEPLGTAFGQAVRGARCPARPAPSAQADTIFAVLLLRIRNCCTSASGLRTEPPVCLPAPDLPHLQRCGKHSSGGCSMPWRAWRWAWRSWRRQPQRRSTCGPCPPSTASCCRRCSSSPPRCSSVRCSWARCAGRLPPACWGCRPSPAWARSGWARARWRAAARRCSG